MYHPMPHMTIPCRLFGVTLTLLLGSGLAHADQYDDPIALFKHAGESAVFFNNCYAYAVFPTIGAGGLVVGGARGAGRVYVRDRLVGGAGMARLGLGVQGGGRA